MDYKIQLLSFLFSFLFGIFFFITNYFNKKLINNKKIIFQYMVTFIYIINIVLFYILILYKINRGVFHIYFLFMVLIGYLFATRLEKYVKKSVKYLKNYIKHKKKVL